MRNVISVADEHPRLFWSKDEMAGLRAKAVHPEMAALRAEILARCESYLDSKHKYFRCSFL